MEGYGINMGQIKSTSDLTGMIINDIILGNPARDGDYYIWDDDRIPSIDIIIPAPIEP
jgi:hypothetical protein